MRHVADQICMPACMFTGDKIDQLGLRDTKCFLSLKSYNFDHDLMSFVRSVVRIRINREALTNASNRRE